MSILCCCIIMNSLGLFILKAISKVKTNHFYILTGLMFANEAIALVWLCRLSIDISNYQNKTVMDVMWCIKIGFVYFWYFMLLMLTFERLMGCVFPLYHRVKMTARKVRKAVLCILIFCMLNSITYSFLDVAYIQKIFYQYISIALDAVCLIAFITTYSLIACRVSSTKIPSNARSPRRSRQQFNKMVTRILVCFLVLEVIPAIVLAILHFTDKDVATLALHIARAIWALNHLNDPFILIFQQKAAKRLVYSYVRKICKKRSQKYKFSSEGFPAPH